MGFFSNLFKRKKGGTFFGNLLRGVSSTLTGGLLGSGKGLAEWQAKEEQKEYNEALAEQQRLIKQSQAFREGQNLANDFNGNLKTFADNSPVAKEVQNNQVKAWISRNWWIPLTAIVTVVLVTVLLVRKRK